MRSMTGYGRGQSAHDGAKFSVELNSVNRKQSDVVKMREREGKHLAKDLIKRLKVVRGSVRKVRQLQPGVVKRYRQSLHDRIERAGIELSLDDERLVKEVIFFADKSDISEEL